jgi:hypothetical protein
VISEGTDKSFNNTFKKLKIKLPNLKKLEAKEELRKKRSASGGLYKDY